MILRAFFIGALALIANLTYSQGEEFSKIMGEHTHSLAVDGQKLSLQGAELLEEAVAASQFVLIAEAHGLAEVQEISTALFAVAHSSGFNHMAIETDPFVTKDITRMAAETDVEAAAYFDKYPMAIPFFYSQEGMQMARDIHALNNVEFWGLDQVFIVAPRVLFTHLIEMAPNKLAKELASNWYDLANAAFGEAMGAGDPSGVILYKITDEDFAELHRAFSSVPEATEMINQMQLTQEIYAYWSSGEYYLNNKVRSDLMKRLFWGNYQSAVAGGEERPKVVFKFGSNHCVRGLTSMHIYDLGNTISELADLNGTKSVHIKMTAARGSSFNMLAGPQEFDDTEDWHEWIKAALNDKVEQADGDLLIVDLRPLRNLRLKNADESIKSLVYGFDFWIVIPNATPVTMFGG